MCINPSAAVAKRDFPFSREENPLASQLIFLAEVVGAKIAAGAASAAMQELFEKGSVVHQELLYSAAQSAGIQVPKPPETAALSSAPGTAPASQAAGPAGQNGAEPMQVDPPAAAQQNGAVNGANTQVNENVVQDIALSIPPERLHAASAAAFLGAATKAKQLAEAEGMLLSGHAMTVLECMTQKMVVKNKYLNDIESEISSVHSKLVETRAAVLKTRDSISEKKNLLKKEKELLAATEKRQKAEMGTSAVRPNGGSTAKKPAEGEIPDGAAKKVAKPSDHPTSGGTIGGAHKAAQPATAPTNAAPAAPTPAAAAVASSAAGAASAAGLPASTNLATEGAAAAAVWSATPATGATTATDAPVAAANAAVEPATQVVTAAEATTAAKRTEGTPSVGAAPTPGSSKPSASPAQVSHCAHTNCFVSNTVMHQGSTTM